MKRRGHALSKRYGHASRSSVYKDKMGEVLRKGSAVENVSPYTGTSYGVVEGFEDGYVMIHWTHMGSVGRPRTKVVTGVSPEKLKIVPRSWV